MLASTLLTAGIAEAASSGEIVKYLSVQVSEKQLNDTTFVVKDNAVVDGKKVGTDTLTCKVVGQSKANCTVVISLPAGKINAKFVIRFSASASGGSGTVTGGSGKYADAKGSLTYKNLNSKGTRTNIVITLE